MNKNKIILVHGVGNHSESHFEVVRPDFPRRFLCP